MKVFVSSTYMDLKNCRDKAFHAIIDAEMVPVAGGMDFSDNSIKFSIKKAIESSDIFLFIIGFRHGSLLENGKSWLEYEFEIAQNAKKPILAFMLSDDASVKPRYIDSDINKIKDFRNNVKSNFLIKYFTNAAELYREIYVALNRISERKHFIPNEQKETEDYIETKTVRIIKLLLSSPADVSKERALVSNAVFRFNQEYLSEKNVFIKLIKWEDMAPQIANGPQKVVNSQLDIFDIFLGIMWNRFGTPTDLASSGTEEEFNDALASWQKQKRPWITFYFCDRPVNYTTSEQLEQKGKVLAFKKKLMSLGILKSYEYLGEFENLIFHDLIKIVDKYLKR